MQILYTVAIFLTLKEYNEPWVNERTSTKKDY